MHIEDEYERLRTFTDDIMESLHQLGGQEYVHDFYAADVKAALNEGKGYLRGSEPK